MSTRALLAGQIRQATPGALRQIARPWLNRWRTARLPKAATAVSEWREVVAGPLRGMQFWLPPAGISPLADRVVAGNYEPDLLEALASLAGERRLAVRHRRPCRASSRAPGWPSAVPACTRSSRCPSNLEAVQRVIARNGLGNAHVHAVALSDLDGEAILLSDASNVSTSSMAYLKDTGGVAESQDSATYQRSTSFTVTTRTLDGLAAELVLPPPSVLKVDVEGAEGHVIRGARTLLSAHAPRHRRRAPHHRRRRRRLDAARGPRLHAAAAVPSEEDALQLSLDLRQRTVGRSRAQPGAHGSASAS